jgi:hypothetical protein
MARSPNRPGARSVTELAAVVLAAAAVATSASPARVAVESATACPTAAEVERRLEVLLPPLGPGEAPARATLAADEAGALRVRLLAPDGTAIGERTVVAAAACADRANVVAVVIAAWEAQERAERVEDPTLPRAARAPEPPTVVVASPPPPPARGPRLELALGAGAAFVDGGAAPSGTLTAALWGRRLGARLEAFGFLPRDAALADGRARWTRLGASLELGARASGRAGRVDAHAGLALAALVASGQGFDADQSVVGASPAARAGVDWTYAFGRLFAGGGASLTLWEAQRLVTAGEPAAAYALPTWQPAVDLRVGSAF